MHTHTHFAKQEILNQGRVRSIEWFDEIDSTNSAARRWLAGRSAAETPALFVADSQTAGRGRSDHRWWSPSGCLMLTLAIDAALMPGDSTRWGQLALLCGVAVARTTSHWLTDHANEQINLAHCPVRLKWPNDVYVGGRKIAGILIESGPKLSSVPPNKGSAQGHEPLVAPEAVGSWLIGIGLNVELDWNQAPEDIAQRATCLRSCVGASVDRAAVLVELTEQLTRLLSQWQSIPARSTTDRVASSISLDANAGWLNEWRERCLLTGKTLRVRVSGSELTGICEGIDTLGQLLLRTPDGELQPLNAGEIISWH